MTHPTHSDAYQPITGTQFSHTPACIWTWVVLMCIELSCEARQHPRGCSSVGRALRSHRRGRGFDYHQLHEGRFHSTGIGLFHFSPPMTIRPRCGGCRAQRDWGGSRADTVKTAPMVKPPQSAFSRQPRQREEDSATAGGSGAEALADEGIQRFGGDAGEASMEAHCGPSALALRLKPSWAMVVAPDATARRCPWPSPPKRRTSRCQGVPRRHRLRPRPFRCRASSPPPDMEPDRLMRQVIVTADESSERAGRRMINHVLSEPARRCRDQHGGNPGIDQRPQHVQYATRPRHPLELLLGDVIDHRFGNLLGRQIRPVLDHRFRAMVKRSARTGPRQILIPIPAMRRGDLHLALVPVGFRIDQRTVQIPEHGLQQHVTHAQPTLY